MPRCPNGHEQHLGLKCSTCGADITYKLAIFDLRTLPRVEPDYGSVSVISVGYRRLSVPADYSGEIITGSADLKTANSFQVTTIRGGNWLDFHRQYAKDLRRWMELMGVQKSSTTFMVINTTNPLSVLAISALPKVPHVAVLAVVADQDSTPVEQNTSYVALSLCLKKGIPVVALSETYEKEMLFFTEDRGFASGGDALSRLLETLLSAADDLTDILERDLKLGVKIHCLSAIVAGSRSVYGKATNAYTAQSYNISMGAKPGDYQTIYSLVFSDKDSEAEFEKGFGSFRNRKFKNTLSAEFRFHESGSQFYDMMTIYGLKGTGPLQDLEEGYKAIVGSVPELTAEGVT